VAALTDAARAARAEAFRLRCDARELRQTARTSGEITRLRARQAAATSRSLRVGEAPSPWSGLRWLRDDEALHTVLVLLD